jgi:hypothetical protein
VVTQVASADAQSGDQVADTTCANGEFPDSSIYGVFKNNVQNLSVYAGFFPNWANPPSSTDVTLTGYDAGGNVVGTDTETVPTGQGAHTLLQLSSSSPNIAKFSVANSTDSNGCLCANIYIDDLTYR